jgi:metallo-beta-lactamase family protein
MIENIRNNHSPFEIEGLTFAGTADESKAINTIKGPIMIIAGSGMCTGGRIKHHLVNNITRPQSTIMFVGYQAVGTLGRRIVDGDNPLRILGHEYPVSARVVRIHGFSAHADKNELLDWLKSMKAPPRKVFVVHGEQQSAEHFARFAAEQTGWNIVVPEFADEIVLD